MGDSSVVVLAQWQGSVHPEASALVAGAARLAALVVGGPAHHSIPVLRPNGFGSERSPRREGVDSYDVLLAARARAAAVLPPGPLLTIGGDCGADLAPVARELAQRDGDLALLWIDAHVDFNTPTTSSSGAFHGMVLRALTGVGPPGLVASPPADPAAVVPAGTRSVDAAEEQELADAGVQLLGMRAFTDPALVVDKLKRTGRSAVHIHLDLDVLDPAVFPHTGYPEPGGARIEQVLALVDAAADALPVVSAFVGEHQGGDGQPIEAVAPLLHRLLTALTEH